MDIGRKVVLLERGLIPATKLLSLSPESFISLFTHRGGSENFWQRKDSGNLERPSNSSVRTGLGTDCLGWGRLRPKTADSGEPMERPGSRREPMRTWMVQWGWRGWDSGLPYHSFSLDLLSLATETSSPVAFLPGISHSFLSCL